MPLVEALLPELLPNLLHLLLLFVHNFLDSFLLIAHAALAFETLFQRKELGCFFVLLRSLLTGQLERGLEVGFLVWLR